MVDHSLDALADVKAGSPVALFAIPVLIKLSTSVSEVTFASPTGDETMVLPSVKIKPAETS